MKWVRRLLLVLVAIGVIAAFVWANRPKPEAVDVAVVTRGAMSVTVDEDARTRVTERYLVAAPTTGHIERTRLRAGDAVREGDLLARIHPLAPMMLDERTRAEAGARLDAARAQLQQARSVVAAEREALEFSQREATRFRALADEGAMPADQADRLEFEVRTRELAVRTAEFGVRVAAHQVEMAEATLSQLLAGTRPAGSDESGSGFVPAAFEVRSPVAGIVLRVIQESEGPVQPGMPLLELGDPSRMEIVADLLTTDAVQVAPGTPTRILRWGGPGELSGRVRLVEPSAFTRLSALGVEEQRVNVIIDVETPRAEWAAVGDGFRAEVSLELWASSDVLQVPASAVFRYGDDWAVYVVDAGAARQRVLSAGHRNGRTVEVIDGVAAGETIILHPGDRISDGVQVAPRP